MKNKHTKIELDLRASIVGDLYREGKVTRSECFRVEMDAFLGEFSGIVNFEDNRDYEELKELA